MDEQVKEFLRESNAIENVFDDDSLKQAIKAWKYIVKFDKLTIDNILKTHAILMQNQPIAPEEKGHFRQRPVWIGGHQAKSWWAITVLMTNWIRDVNSHVWSEDDDIPKEEHIYFEAIHPFVDGNGRLGRILLNWQRIRLGLPILIIKNDEKQKYYEWFQ